MAEEFGVKVATFQHVLEGYKVADEMARHGAGGSTFSDWWAYKLEVYDAIPYNGALMRERGVLVSFNSDSDELARRLNWEAAKAVRYGGVAPADALAFVTINPARQLGIDEARRLARGRQGRRLRDLERRPAVRIDDRAGDLDRREEILRPRGGSLAARGAREGARGAGGEGEEDARVRARRRARPAATPAESAARGGRAAGLRLPLPDTLRGRRP